MPHALQAGDYPAYYDNYFGRLADKPVLELLQTQPAAFFELLADVSEEQAEKSYLPGKWNTKQVLGHLMDTERIMLYRALCISRGESQVLPGFEENQYVEQGGFSARTLASLIEEYQSVRESTLSFFGNLAPQAFARKGLANGAPVSVQAIFTFIAAHEAHHLHLWQQCYQPMFAKPTSL